MYITINKLCIVLLIGFVFIIIYKRKYVFLIRFMYLFFIREWIYLVFLFLRRGIRGVFKILVVTYS